MFNLPVALHGRSDGGRHGGDMAGGLGLDQFLHQEHEPQMLELFNPWLIEPLRLSNGKLVVPDGAGLGIRIDESRMMRDVVGSVEAALG